MSYGLNLETELVLRPGLLKSLNTLLLPSFVILAAYLYKIVQRSDPLGDIPGPFLARWTPFWLAYHARIGDRYLAVHDMHKKYGKFVRISPNHISVSDKDALPVVYGQGNGAFHKSKFYHAFVGEKASVFSTTDRQDHAQKRRLVSQAFSAKALMDFTHFIHDIVLTFVDKLDQMCKENEWVDALHWFNFLAFDVLSDLAFGEAIGMVANGSDEVAVQKQDGSFTTERAIELVDEREHLAAVLGIHPMFKPLSRLMPDPFFWNGRKSTNGLGDLGRRKVMQRLESQSDRRDILGRLIEARGGKSALGADEISVLTAETITLLIAGSDTTSNSMTAIVHLVMKHPHVHQRLLEVLDREISLGEETNISYDSVKDIPYLDAVINEGLRIYATTAIGLHRSVPSGGAWCCGRYFPEGTEMSVPAWTIQHDSEIWGDPETFRPERWIGNNDLLRYLLTFGKGPRACLGRNLAYMEMRLVLATVFLRYNIQLHSPVLETTEGFMHKPLSMKVKFTRRTRPSYD